MKERVVLAYSGGLDTSIILKWLQQEKSLEVFTLTVDLGQIESSVDVQHKAFVGGAKDASVVDAKDEFVRDFVFPMLRAMPLYEGAYLLGTSIARPIIAKHLVHYAKKLGAKIIAHGATGKGNDQVRFELSVAALAGDLGVIAPWREWNFQGRTDLEAYARQHGISVPTTPKAPWSYDGNAFHCSFEGGILEDPDQEPPESLYRMTSNPMSAPDTPEYVDIEFVNGDPVSVNGQVLSPVDVLAQLNAIGGRNGLGRVDIVENRTTGIKSRGVYETPGGTLIQHARRAVESLVLDASVINQRDKLAIDYSSQIYRGLWFSPEREALQVYFDHVARDVSGTARVKLFKGACWIVRRKSPLSLYRRQLASFEAGEGFDQRDAGGFIKILSQRLKNRASNVIDREVLPCQ